MSHDKRKLFGSRISSIFSTNDSHHHLGKVGEPIPSRKPASSSATQNSDPSSSAPKSHSLSQLTTASSLREVSLAGLFALSQDIAPDRPEAHHNNDKLERDTSVQNVAPFDRYDLVGPPAASINYPSSELPTGTSLRAKPARKPPPTAESMSSRASSAGPGNHVSSANSDCFRDIIGSLDEEIDGMASNLGNGSSALVNTRETSESPYLERVSPLYFVGSSEDPSLGIASRSHSYGHSELDSRRSFPYVFEPHNESDTGRSSADDSSKSRELQSPCISSSLVKYPEPHALCHDAKIGLQSDAHPDTTLMSNATTKDRSRDVLLGMSTEHFCDWSNDRFITAEPSQVEGASTHFVSLSPSRMASYRLERQERLNLGGEQESTIGSIGSLEKVTGGFAPTMNTAATDCDITRFSSNKNNQAVIRSSRPISQRPGMAQRSSPFPRDQSTNHLYYNYMKKQDSVAPYERSCQQTQLHNPALTEAMSRNFGTIHDVLPSRTLGSSDNEQSPVSEIDRAKTHTRVLSVSSTYSAGSMQHVSLATLKMALTLRPGEGEKSTYVDNIRKSAGTSYNDMGPGKWKLPIGIMPVDKRDVLQQSTKPFNRGVSNTGYRSKKSSGVELKHGHLQPRLLAAEVDEGDSTNRFGALGRSSTLQNKSLTPVTSKSSLPSGVLNGLSRANSLERANTLASVSTTGDLQSSASKFSNSRRGSTLSFTESIGSTEIDGTVDIYYQHPGFKHESERPSLDEEDRSQKGIFQDSEDSEDDKPGLYLANPDSDSC